jgi:hypothetical protein
MKLKISHSIEDVSERFYVTNDWISKQKSVFFDTFFKVHWKHFHDEYQQDQRNGASITPDFYGYFHEDGFIRNLVNVDLWN